MSPLRIVILIILFYLLYRLLFAGRIAAAKRKGRKEEESESDILKEDPICGKLVPSRQAEVLVSQGKRYYFCSRKCRDSFRQQQGDNT